MINLSKRLKKISDYIEKEDTVLDVGCDHALIDIYLSIKYNKKYYASDLKENRLVNAKNNLKKYNAKNVILKSGNGLEVLTDCDGVDTLIVSGMGYITIIGILRNIKKITNINKIIIESNSNPEKVRKFMVKNGFYIYNESLVFENNFYYIISCYKRGKKRYKKDVITYGLVKDNTDTISYKKYIELELKKNKILLNVVPKKYFIKRLEIKKNIKYFDKQKKNSN